MDDERVFWGSALGPRYRMPGKHRDHTPVGWLWRGRHIRKEDPPLLLIHVKDAKRLPILGLITVQVQALDYQETARPPQYCPSADHNFNVKFAGAVTRFDGPLFITLLAKGVFRDNKPAGRASFQLSNLIRDGNVVSLFGDDRLHCRYEGYFPLDLRGCYAGKIRLELVASLPRESAPEKLEAALIRQLEAQKQDDLHAAGKQPELLSRDDSVLNSDSGSETQWVQWWVEMKKHVVTGKQHSPFSVPLLFPGPAWEECLRRKETRDRGTQATPRVVDEVREARLDRNPAVLPELFKVGKWTEHGPVEVSSVSERFDKILLPAVKADNFSRPLPNTEDKKSVQLEKLRTTKATSSDGERGAYTQITSESDSANENAPLHHLFDPKGSSIFDQMTEEHLPLMNPSDDLPLMNPSDEEHLPLMNPSDEEHLPRMNPSDNLPLMNPSDEEHLPLMKPINEEHLPLMNPINEEHLPLINPTAFRSQHT